MNFNTKKFIVNTYFNNIEVRTRLNIMLGVALYMEVYIKYKY